MSRPGLSAVITGNPIDGFEVVGPFKQPQYAADWADTWTDDVDWWVVPLQSEEEYQDARNQEQGVRSD